MKGAEPLLRSDELLVVYCNTGVCPSLILAHIAEIKLVLFRQLASLFCALKSVEGMQMKAKGLLACSSTVY